MKRRTVLGAMLAGAAGKGYAQLAQSGAGGKPSSGPGAATIVQTKAASSSFGTTPTITFDAGVTEGNTILVAFRLVNSTQPIVSVQTNTAEALSLEVNRADQPDSGDMYLYRRHAVGSGITSITVTISASDVIEMRAWEVAGLANQAAEATANGTTPFETGPHDDVSVTTLTENAAVFAFFRAGASRTLDSVASGWAGLPASGSGFGWGVYDDNTGAAGGKTPGLTFTSAANTAAIVAAYEVE
jgi:hypothetical protein